MVSNHTCGDCSIDMELLGKYPSYIGVGIYEVIAIYQCPECSDKVSHTIGGKRTKIEYNNE